eukprot:4331490-Amphidinium_carterae.1
MDTNQHWAEEQKVIPISSSAFTSASSMVYEQCCRAACNCSFSHTLAEVATLASFGMGACKGQEKGPTSRGRSSKQSVHPSIWLPTCSVVCWGGIVLCFSPIQVPAFRIVIDK